MCFGIYLLNHNEYRRRLRLFFNFITVLLLEKSIWKRSLRASVLLIGLDRKRLLWPTVYRFESCQTLA